jgi:DivIVA domain-containing protein
VARSGSREPDETESEPSPGSAEQGRGSIELRGVPAEIRDVSFRVSVRGYDRGAVDAYVTRVTQLIAELDATRSPEAAVRHALEQVGKQTSGLLQRAGETAEEITAAARREAEERTARAKAEAEEIVAKAKTEADEILERTTDEAETTAAQSRKEAAERLKRAQDEIAALREQAEARLRELDADTEAIRQERRALLDDMRGISVRVAAAASEADARFPPSESAESADEETLELEPEAETEPSGVAAPDELDEGNGGRRVRPGR